MFIKQITHKILTPLQGMGKTGVGASTQYSSTGWISPAELTRKTRNGFAKFITWNANLIQGHRLKNFNVEVQGPDGKWGKGLLAGGHVSQRFGPQDHYSGKILGAMPKEKNYVADREITMNFPYGKKIIKMRNTEGPAKFNKDPDAPESSSINLHDLSPEAGAALEKIVNEYRIKYPKFNLIDQNCLTFQLHIFNAMNKVGYLTVEKPEVLAEIKNFLLAGEMITPNLLGKAIERSGLYYSESKGPEQTQGLFYRRDENKNPVLI